MSAADWPTYVSGLVEALTVPFEHVESDRWVLKTQDKFDVELSATPAGLRLSAPAATMVPRPDLLLQATREWSAGTLCGGTESPVAATWVPFDAQDPTGTRAKHLADAYRRLIKIIGGLRTQSRIVDPLPPRKGTDSPLQGVARCLDDLGLQHYEREGDLVVAIDPGDGGRFIVAFSRPAPGWISVDAWPTTGHERPFANARDFVFALNLNAALMLGAIILVADNMPRWRACLPQDQVLGPGTPRVNFLLDHAAAATLEIVRHNQDAPR